MNDKHELPDWIYTVADLIKDLQELDPALPVLVQSDPEGNDYFWCRGGTGSGSTTPGAEELFVDPAALKSDRTREVLRLNELEEHGDLGEDSGPDDYVRVAVVYP